MKLLIKTTIYKHLIFALLLFCSVSIFAQQLNTVGMKMIRIEPGRFQMGCADGDYDEKPVHLVVISSPFHLSSTEVTNLQYERFRPEHRMMRGMQHTSYSDSDPVVFVSWDDAMAYCSWLSQQEGKHYRLPTEAEWEYACRAGTTTYYSTGNELPDIYRKGNANGDAGGFWPGVPDPLKATPNLTVAQTPANPWGLYDMHGNVEEWCYDFYGPYKPDEQTDPAGCVDGDFKVSRGGSHTTEFGTTLTDANPQKRMDLRYLSSSNRMGSLRDDRNWLVGFRVAEGNPINTSNTSVNNYRPLNQVNVSQNRPNLTLLPNDYKKGKPWFRGPIPFVIPPKAPADTALPFYYHNHVPSITEMPNGDLMAIWYNTLRESGRELKYVASRKRYGTSDWEPASLFFDAPDRNDHGGLIWWNGNDTIFHFNGLSAGNTWYYLALVMRYSTDNGANWSKPVFIDPQHRFQNMPIASMLRDKKGRLIFTCDAVPGGEGGSVVWISADGGKTWRKPAEGKAAPDFKEGSTGAWIAGIHAPIVECPDGSLLSIGRGNNINGMQPRSVSIDGGETWTYSQSDFPSIGSGQRCTLQRLQSGNIFFASFDPALKVKNSKGEEQVVSGLYAALSVDGGKSFPFRRLITNEEKPGIYNGWGWQHEFEMSAVKAEPKGYVTSTITRNGLIHLITSGNEYIFNEEWIKATKN
jgi:formylglycine-generating enzyme required for sulfatase activity